MSEMGIYHQLTHWRLLFLFRNDGAWIGDARQPLFQVLHFPAPDFVTRVAVLLARLGSNVAAPTVAVLLMLLPVVVTFTVNDRLSVAFRFSVETVQLSVPVELTGSGVQVQGPAATLTNFVPAGIGSFNNNCRA